MLFSYSFRSMFNFFYNDTAPTKIYPLSLHDALPISAARGVPAAVSGLATDRSVRALARGRPVSEPRRVRSRGAHRRLPGEEEQPADRPLTGWGAALAGVLGTRTPRAGGAHRAGA